MKDIYLCLDVGGTEIKAAPVDAGGALLQPLRHFPARSHQSAPHFVGPFCLCSSGNSPGQAISGIRLAFPGPFDYEAGICLLQGLGKLTPFMGSTSVMPWPVAWISNRKPFGLPTTPLPSPWVSWALVWPKQRRAPCSFASVPAAAAPFGVGGALAPWELPAFRPVDVFTALPFLEGVWMIISPPGAEKLTQEYLGMPLDGKSLAHLAQEGIARRSCAFGLWPANSGRSIPVSCAISPGCSVLWRSNHTQRLVFPEAHGTCLPHAEYPALHHRRHLRPYTSGLNPHLTPGCRSL